jgi:hypothetical protein
MLLSAPEGSSKLMARLGRDMLSGKSLDANSAGPLTGTVLNAPLWRPASNELPRRGTRASGVGEAIRKPTARRERRATRQRTDRAQAHRRARAAACGPRRTGGAVSNPLTDWMHHRSSAVGHVAATNRAVTVSQRRWRLFADFRRAARQASRAGTQARAAARGTIQDEPSDADARGRI